MKKKVLILQNGISHYRIPFYNGLSEFYDVTVAYTGECVVSSELSKLVNVIELKKIVLFGFYFHPGLLKLQRKFDVTIAMFDLRWVTYILAGILANRSIFWSHCYGRSKFLNKIRPIILKRASAVLTYYSAFFDRLERDGINRSRLFATENTIFISSPELSDYKKRKNFIFVGRYQNRKKVEEILDSFEIAEKFLPEDINLVFIGSGFEEFYKNKVKGRIIESKVKVINSIHNESILREYFKASLAYVSPGHVGLGVLHSFSYGVPVITLDLETHAPEYSNCVDGVNSIILSSIEKLASAMVNLEKDRSMGEEMAKNAYSLYVNHRTMEQMVQRTKCSLDYVLSCND